MSPQNPGIPEPRSNPTAGKAKSMTKPKGEEEVEYQVRPCKIVGLRKRAADGPKDWPWRKGTLVREWKDGSASIRTELTGDGWLVIRLGHWRRSK